MNPVLKAKIAAMLLAIDSVVRDSSSIWKDKAKVCRELDREDNGNLSEFLSWFDGGE